jgi:hypothetical protein
LNKFKSLNCIIEEFVRKRNGKTSWFHVRAPNQWTHRVGAEPDFTLVQTGKWKLALSIISEKFCEFGEPIFLRGNENSNFWIANTCMVIKGVFLF